MSTDDPQPSTLTIETLAEDLSLSNEEGTSWFIYDLSDDPDVIIASLYGYEGTVEKRFALRISVEEL